MMEGIEITRSSVANAPIRILNGVERLKEVAKESRQMRSYVAEKAEYDKKSKQVDLANTLKKANSSFGPVNKRIHFREHPGSKKSIIQVIDRDTGEVIIEVPPVELLDLGVRVKAIVGLLMDRST